MFAAMPVIMIVTHYLTVIPHEYSHSFMAWIVGIKSNPLLIDWGGTGAWNLFLLAHIDENVDYTQALAAGDHWQVALAAFAGPGIGNGLGYVVARLMIKRRPIVSRPWVALWLFWYLFFCVANLYDYVPLRVFADDGDVTHFVLGWQIDRWWIYTIVGYLVLWIVVDFYRSVLPSSLQAIGFESFTLARAAMLVAVTLWLFGYFALPALMEEDSVSLFMGRTSLALIPVVVVAAWNRSVVRPLRTEPTVGATAAEHEGTR
ncbi:hypothetical protein [Williamsia soli]|uniref:hypothetical protein n=1 Tax=Williamsia soli TaxID=364929 RepID=UPI001A9D174E|nr:hypothetical protein [Williamsia soli]